MGLAYLVGEALGILRVCIPYLWGHHETASVRGWAVCLLALLLVGAPLGIALVPVPNSVVTKGVLSSEVDLVLRATTDGFLSGVHVDSGEHLTAGQMVVVLEDAEATSALAEVEGRLEAAQVMLDRALEADMATHTQESHRVQQLEVERNMLAEEVARLQILTPIDARVIELMHAAQVRLSHLSNLFGQRHPLQDGRNDFVKLSEVNCGRSGRVDDAPKKQEVS